MKGRVLTLVFSSPEEAVHFLKTLEKLLPGKSFLGELKANKVKIFIPESENSEKTMHKIKQLYNQQRQPYSYGVMKNYDISSIFSMAKLEVPVPVTLLVEALKIQGRKAIIKGDILYTDATLNEIIKVVERLSVIYKEVLSLETTAQARRLISLYSFVNNKPVDSAVEELSKLGILTESSGKLTLKVNYDVALKALFGSSLEDAT
ncbi:DUF2067 family protein [Infirmifilum lucidum]|uniref:DUF2067 family protein n=1 Tax=Infirmifilum lucidum TaxID=2776706 RepID=A0A7L9FGL4_9CREN|nr:DUF2067 family protein [Infirmifilum lucidum]QOJ78163.1 DUF2067 family protein [Infirmifilum lucidum]